MSYKVVDVLPGARGFDTIESLSASQYETMHALGFTFRWGYLGDLHVDEIAKATSASVGIMVIQHARAVGWNPDSARGAEDGARAVRDASSAQLPKTLPLWCDLEECNAAATYAEVDAYAKTWCAAVVGSGHAAEVYVGSNVPADAAGLWHLPFTGYARSFSNVPTPAKRGYKLIQLFSTYPKGECFVRDAFPGAPPNVAGINIDIDIAQCDYLGARPKMLVAA
jgi:hypothetical protein